MAGSDPSNQQKSPQGLKEGEKEKKKKKKIGGVNNVGVTLQTT